MPDLYVNSSSGTDVADGGNTTATPLRSLTFAVDEAARRFSADRTTIHLAAGAYGVASGETYPIEMPQNISVIGAGQASTIILAERGLTEEFYTALSGGEELARFTLQGRPVDPGSCFPLTGIVQTISATSIHDITIERAPGAATDEVAFGRGMVLANTASVQRVTVRDCDDGIVFGGGDATVASCTLTGNRAGVRALGPGAVTDCDLTNNHAGVHANAGSGAVASGNRFTRNTHGVLVVPSVTPGTELVVVRDNRFESNTYGVVCLGDAEVVNNDVITDHHQTGLLAGTTFPAGRPFRDTPVSHPVFRGNRVSRRGARDPSIRQAPLALFGSTSAPIVESNRFWTVEGWLLPLVMIHHDALPDLGGGAGGSAGANRFESGWLMFVSGAEFPSKTIAARNNFWRTVPPRQGVNVYVPLEWYVDPESRRGTIVCRTDGARAL